MGLAVTFVMIMASAVTYPIYRYLLLQFDLTYLNTLVFILVIAAFCPVGRNCPEKFIPALHKSLGSIFPDYHQLCGAGCHTSQCGQQLQLP